LGLGLLALVAGVFAGCNSGGSSKDDGPSPPPPVGSRQLAAQLNVLGLIAAQNGGDRAAGTKGYSGSVAYVAGVLRRMGWRVQVQPVPMTEWHERSPASLTVAGRAARPVRDFRVPGYSGSGTVQGTLHATDDGCQQEDFSSLQPGQVAFTGFGKCFLYRKAMNAKRAGASALIAQTTGSPRGVAFATLVVPNIGLPVVLMSRRVPARDGDTVQLRVDAASRRARTQNVIAEIGPSHGRVTMAGAHLDSVPDGPGINDNGSGVAALLEVARTFGPRPPGRVRLAFWGGEEFGLLGSRRYVRSLSRDQRHEIADYLNFDMLGSPNAVPAVYSDGDERLGALLRKVHPGDERGVLVGNRSDGSSFEQAGIPVNGLYSGADEPGQGGRPRDPCYHLPCDTVANVDMGSLLPMASAAARALYLLSSGQAK
jgi:Zn-dependent M28 family amino/carboxypeptidase